MKNLNRNTHLGKLEIEDYAYTQDADRKRTLVCIDYYFESSNEFRSIEIESKYLVQYLKKFRPDLYRNCLRIQATEEGKNEYFDEFEFMLIADQNIIKDFICSYWKHNN